MKIENSDIEKRLSEDYHRCAAKNWMIGTSAPVCNRSVGQMSWRTRIKAAQVTSHLQLGGDRMDDPGEASVQGWASALDLTLAEQMQITQMEIDHRLRLLGLHDRDVEILKGCRPTVVLHLDRIVDEFYRIQRREPEISLLIGDQETFRRLHASMKRYIVELFDGYYDAQYVNKRLRIGMVHKRIGVSPKLYISAINLLGTILERYVITARSGSVDDRSEDGLRFALRKVLMFDVQLVFDTYIRSLLSEVELAKKEVERYASGLERTVAERTCQLEALARIDSLTGLANQRAFYDEMRRELARTERFRESLVLAYIDLNRFKTLNDRDGHRAGDELLALVGQCLKDVSRETDFCYRYGGDEFCVILTNTVIPMAKGFTTRLFEKFDQVYSGDVSFSIGLAQANADELPSVDELVRQSDANMYLAKEQSRGSPGHHVCSGT